MKIGIKGLLISILGGLCFVQSQAGGSLARGGVRELQIRNGARVEIVARFEFQGRVGRGYCSGIWRGVRARRDNEFVSPGETFRTSCVNLLDHLTVWIHEPNETKVLVYRHRDPSRSSRRDYNLNIVDGQYVIQSEGNESNRVPVGSW